MKSLLAVVAIVLFSCRELRCAQADNAVDLRLVLAADVSRSINETEFSLQRNGYAAAIRDHRVIEAIQAGRHAAIVVTFVEWAGAQEQQTVVDWMRIANDDDAKTFADRLTAAPRSFVGRTAIGSAIDYAFSKFADSAVDAERNVIDVSGDGTSNQGADSDEARDAAVKHGATINGLAIFNKDAAQEGGYLAAHTNPPKGIDGYYREHVIGGEDAFVLRIENFNSFEQAMIRKLITEISLRFSAGGKG